MKAQRIVRFVPVIAATAALAVTASVTAPTSALAAPDPVVAAQKTLDSIQAQSSSIDSKYTQLQEQLDAADHTLGQADAQLATGLKRVAQLRKGLGQLALINFQTAGIGTTTRLITSPDDTSFLNNLAVVQSVTNRSNGQLQELQASQAELTALEAQAKQSRDTIASVTSQQKQLVQEYNQKEASAKALLAKLTAAQKKRLAELQQQRDQAALRAALGASATSTSATSTSTTSRSATRAPLATSTPVSGRAAAAVAFALAQVGKAYVYGAVGPGAYDCSGLMLRAWGAAGVSLPRTSQSQYSAGTHIALSNLQPGDLVFYYSGLTHVGMYIGGGRIVNAENPSTGVVVASLTSMPVVGATRVG